MSKHRHEMAKRGKRAEGGASMGSKGSYVDRVAHEEGDGGHKKGGRVKKRHGGKIDGKHESHRLDRPGRKRGGAAGADAKPMTEASKLTQPEMKSKDDQPEEDIRSPRTSGGSCEGEYARGGRLSAHEREKMPKSEFALPGKGKGPKGAGAGSYPIPDESHARNALARVSQHGSPAEKAEVRRKVRAKYPDIHVS